MTQTFNVDDFNELLFSEATQIAEGELEAGAEEVIWQIPKQLGRGKIQELELVPGVQLQIFNGVYHNNMTVRVPVHEHEIQLMFFVSGFSRNDVHPEINSQNSYFSGSGMSPLYVERYSQSQQTQFVSVHLEPQMFESLLQDSAVSVEVQRFLKTEEWKEAVFPAVTPAIRLVVQQILQCPMQVMLRRLYLQTKVLELLALQLDVIWGSEAESSRNGEAACAVLPRLKPRTIARLHEAKEILTKRYDRPPSLLELAQQVGMSDRTLRRGFRELFGTTVMGYVVQQRMQRAEQLLRETDLMVTDVAHQVGYSNMGHFAATFRKQFGISPTECMLGKKTGSGS